MDLYCEDHQSVCCCTCIAVTHRRCDVVITLSEYGEKVRSSSMIEDMRTNLQEVAEAMEYLTEDIKNQTEHLGNGRDLVMKQMTDLRQKFEERLNKLQLDLTNELTIAYKEEKQKLDGMLHKCERMCNGIKTTQVLSEADVIQKDDIQMLSLLQRGSMEIKSCQDLIAQLADTFTTVDLKLDHDDEEMMNNSLILGRLNVTRTRWNIPVNPLSITPLSLAQVKEVGKLCIKTGSDRKRCRASGLVYLSNGRIIVTDNGNSKVKMFKESGELVDEVILQGPSWDLCLVDNNTVAVAMRDKQIVSIIKIESSKLSHVPDADIKTGKQCDGITYKEGRYVMATGISSVHKIYSLTNKNDKVRVLHQPNSRPYYLTYDPNSGDVIVSLHSDTVGATAVYRLSPDGTTTEIAKVGLVRNGNGVDVDREGNVYVCGRASNNVVQISQDGNKVRELVTPSEDLREPLTLSVCDNKFVVSNDDLDTSKYIKIYEFCKDKQQ
ncbi:uncharacterized protein LOC110448282 [Mizuhopecten yessoensis]|uniref:Tripartite motif-containing protein 2 n=1 Tax=Mizuhopecten yessoensis TaxID=6573 RepID=A0A210QTL6_MIZYE|nr:uncharacterized protein LOC110448282 [Mizuhopecten yessoensis]OWF52050.1 hypothetical protein KP79_PYT17875 [Mizuhopecten yessoensis]